MKGLQDLQFTAHNAQILPKLTLGARDPTVSPPLEGQIHKACTAEPLIHSQEAESPLILPVNELQLCQGTR